MQKVLFYTYRCDDTRGCVMQFWPPDDEHMCSKHVEVWNKLIVKQKFCASSWLFTEINILRCTVSKTSKFGFRCFITCILLFIAKILPTLCVLCETVCMRLCLYPQECILIWIYRMQINYITLQKGRANSWVAERLLKTVLTTILPTFVF